MDKPILDFMNSKKKRTGYVYKSYLEKYLAFTQKNGEQLLREKREDKEFKVEQSIMDFRKWLLDKGFSQGYAKSCVGCVRGFYGYYRMPLVFRKAESKELSEAERTTEDYLFDREDLGKMALCGNLKERYVLLVGKSVGLRASDFITFTYGKFRSLKLDNEPPIFLGETKTVKEKVKAYPFLDSDAIPIVKQVLDSNKDKPDNERILHDTQENLSVILRTLAQKATVEPHGKRIRFHCLRKFLIDRLSANASESQWKQIVGKKIEEKAYVSTEQLRQVYGRTMKDTLINGNGHKTRKLIELENALVESQKRVTALETTNQTLRQKIAELESQQNTMNKSIADLEDFKTVVQKKLGIKEKTKFT